MVFCGDREEEPHMLSKKKLVQLTERMCKWMASRGHTGRKLLRLKTF